MNGWAPRLALRRKLKVIWKLPVLYFVLHLRQTGIKKTSREYIDIAVV